MSTNKSVHRSLAILKLPKRVPAFVTLAQSVVSAMTNNTKVSSPTPTLSTVTAAITALQSAESAAPKKVPAHKPRDFVAEQGAVSGC